MQHKTAGELKPRDRFDIAGGHYEIIDVYETNDDNIIKCAIMAVNGANASTRRLYLTLDRSILMFLL